jgi:hypothetical protein
MPNPNQEVWVWVNKNVFVCRFSRFYAWRQFACNQRKPIKADRGGVRYSPVCSFTPLSLAGR